MCLDRECRRVASDVVSDSSASEYLGRFEFTPNVFTVVLKDDEGDEYCYDRVVSKIYTLKKLQVEF